MADDLEQRWREAFGQYHTLKGQSEAQVVGWELASAPRYSLRPLHFERFPGRGRVLKEAPTQWTAECEYGFDAQDRLLVARQYSYAGPFETFYLYTPDAVLAITYAPAPQGIPWEVVRQALADGRIVEYEEFKVNFGAQIGMTKPDQLLDHMRRHHGIVRQRESCVYEDNRLVRVEGWVDNGYGSPFTTTHELTYDDRGRVLRATLTGPDAAPQITYQRKAKGQTIQSLGAEVNAKLLAEIPRLIREAKLKEQIYCLVLSYQDVLTYFPPNTVLGRESYRRLQLAQGTDEARYTIWAPVMDERARQDFEKLSINDPAIIEGCQVLNQLIEQKEAWNQGKKLLRQLAADLMKVDWAGIMDVTEDFVCFAVDYEMDELSEAMSASIPRDQLKALRKKGYLPEEF